MRSAAVRGNWVDLLQNGFWPMVPVLAINLLFAADLPPPFQMEAFWADIPAWIGVPENILRSLVLFLPIILHIGLRTPTQRLGLIVYIVGIAAYAAAWAMQILLPHSGWSLSIPGFFAPAYTPLLWLVGTGLMADRSFVPGFPYRPWMYALASVAFLSFHISHTAIVFARTI